MKGKPTPGPWKVTDDFIAIWSDNEENNPKQIASLDSEGSPEIDADESIANAYLIAAAPELRDALSQLLDRLDYHGSIDLVREEGPIQDARDALDKTKGEE